LKNASKSDKNSPVAKKTKLEQRHIVCV